MSERIERWANVYGELDGKEYIDGFYLTRDQARNNAAFGYLRQARLVEIRDGESVRDDSANQWNLEAHANHVRELTERAEKAEVTVRARDAEIEVLRAFLKQFEDGGMSGNEVREAKSDERARFERETAAKLMCRIVETRTLKGGIGSVCEHMGPMTAANEARKLADIYFGAEEDAK